MTHKRIYQLIFILSLMATLGSLYYGYYGDPYQNMISGELFNTNNGIVPCAICWYIRIAQYPILLISGMSLIRQDYKVTNKYILGLSFFGLLISGYKAMLEYDIITTKDIGFCTTTPGVSCSTPVYLFNSGISLSLVGLIIFIVIICLLIVKIIQTSD